MKIKLIGNYPPPIGGISIHIERMVGRLLKDNIEVIVYDDCYLPKPSIFRRILKLVSGKFTLYIGKKYEKEYEYNFVYTLKGFKKLFLALCFNDRKTESLIYYHTKNWKYRAALCLTAFFNKKNKILITIHSMRDVYKDLSFSNKLLSKFVLKHADHFIVTNSHIKNKLSKWGGNEDKISVIPPFLPPNEKETDFKEIPDSVWDFIANRSPVISANAFQLKFYNGQDLYGLDMCVELCENLVKEYANVGFVFSLPEVGDIKYFNKIKSTITQKGIERNFLFITSPFMLYPILKNSDLFLRPTNTDGDALSIREALSFSVPVIASNIVERPIGSILFNNRDIADLSLKAFAVLKDLDFYKKEVKSIPQNDNYLEIVSLIKNLSSSNS